MIEINNLTNFVVDKRFFVGIAKKVLKGENKEIESLSIAFVDTKEIQKANKKFRKKDKPTDVLSFERNLDVEDDFNEVVICPEIVKENTKASNLNFKEELSRVLIHGILHTLGYDHEISKKEEERGFRMGGFSLFSSSFLWAEAWCRFEC